MTRVLSVARFVMYNINMSNRLLAIDELFRCIKCVSASMHIEPPPGGGDSAYERGGDARRVA